MKIIEDLRQIMNETGISPDTASKFIGCSGRQIYRWLKGESIPSFLAQEAIKKGIRRIKKFYQGGNLGN